MNFQSDFDSSFYDNFYQDPQPNFTISHMPSNLDFAKENEVPDYSFLPKPNTFFDNFICNPIEVPRPKNEMETAENTPLEQQKLVSPDALESRKYNIQNFNSSFSSLRPKPLESSSHKKFTAVLGVSTGITFSGFNKSAVSPSLKDQSPASSNLSPGFSEGIQGSEFDEEDLENMEVYMNKQLTSLQEAQLWSEEKDEILLKLGAQFKCDWKKITKKFGHKKITPNFLKTRFKELTCSPLQRRVKFSHSEDLMIAKYFDKYGSHWGQMATHFKNRSPIMLKNRYYSFIRKRGLLGPLLKKVRELEGNKEDIEDFKDEDLERRFNELNVQRSLTNQTTSDQPLDPFNFDADRSYHSEFYEASPTLSNYNETRSPLFECEANQSENTPILEEPTSAPPTTQDMKCIKLFSSITNEVSNTAEDLKVKEIETLKSQVKSLQALYLKTKAELDKRKLKGEDQ